MKDKKISTKELTLIGMMTAITCMVAPFSITIPISVVPISFTVLILYISVFIIGWKRGMVSYLIYLLMGFVGLPVFSGMTGGPGKVFGPTGGYLLGFIFLILITGIFIEAFHGKIYMYALGMIIGLIVTYALGTLWLSYQLHLSFYKGLLMGVIPYLPGDAIKIVVALVVGPVLKKNLAGVNSDKKGYVN